MFGALDFFPGQRWPEEKEVFRSGCFFFLVVSVSKMPALISQ